MESQPDHSFSYPEIKSSKRCIQGHLATHFCQSAKHDRLKQNHYICGNRTCKCSLIPRFSLRLILAKDLRHQGHQNHPTHGMSKKKIHVKDACEYVNINDLIRIVNHKVKNVNRQYYNYQLKKLTKLMGIMIGQLQIKRDELAYRMKKNDFKLYLDNNQLSLFQCFNDPSNSNISYLDINVKDIYQSMEINQDIFTRRARRLIDQNIIKFGKYFENILGKNPTAQNNGLYKSQEWEKIKLKQQNLFIEKFSLNYCSDRQNSVASKTQKSQKIDHDMSLSAITQYLFDSEELMALQLLMTSSLPNLHTLTLEIDARTSQTLLKYTNILLNIKKLDLEIFQVKNFESLNFTPFYSHLQKLQNLKINWRADSSEINKLVMGFKDLKQISLCNSPLNYQTIQIIDSRNPDLRKLQIEWDSDNKSQDEKKVNEANIQLNFKNLEHVVIGYNASKISWISKILLSNIKQLTIKTQNDIGKLMIEAIVNNGLKSLQKLNINSCKITDEIVSQIAKGDYKLKMINLQKNRIGSSGFQSLITSQPLLEVLILDNQQTQELQSQITKQQFQNILLKLPNLKKLSFDLDNKINFYHFYQLAKMKHIDLVLNDRFFESQIEGVYFSLRASNYFRTYHWKLINNVDQVTLRGQYQLSSRKTKNMRNYSLLLKIKGRSIKKEKE